LDSWQEVCSQSPEHDAESRVSTISKNTLDEREQASRPAEQVESTVTILNVGRTDEAACRPPQKQNFMNNQKNRNDDLPNSAYGFFRTGSEAQPWD